MSSTCSTNPYRITLQSWIKKPSETCQSFGKASISRPLKKQTAGQLAFKGLKAGAVLELTKCGGWARKIKKSLILSRPLNKKALACCQIIVVDAVNRCDKIAGHWQSLHEAAPPKLTLREVLIMTKTMQDIQSEYDAKKAKYKTLGLDEATVIQLLADADRVRTAELAALAKSSSQAIQLTPTLSLSFPVLEDTVKEDRKTKEEYAAVKGGTVNLSYKVGKGKQTSYTAYLPLSMYETIINQQEAIKDAIAERKNSGHTFKISGITSVAATQDAAEKEVI